MTPAFDPHTSAVSLSATPIRARAAPPPPADGWALFLDVDGCLIDLAATPDAVIVAPGLSAQLAALSLRLDGALALVSGRAIVTLDRLFAPSTFHAAGLHGVERRLVGGDAQAPAVPPQLADIRAEAQRRADAHPGALVEDKGAAIALHWRGAPDAEHDLQAFAMHALLRLPGYRLQHGQCLVELRPDHADKGSAIAAFMASPPFAGRVPVFAGDDLTDEAGFSVVNAMGGISVLVGDRERSAARHALADPSAVRAWLGVDAGARDAPPLDGATTGDPTPSAQETLR